MNGTYTQRRRDQMAYGGIAGLDGRKRYWIGSAFQKWIKDPIEMLITGKTPAQLEAESQARVDREDAMFGPLLKESCISALSNKSFSASVI